MRRLVVPFTLFAVAACADREFPTAPPPPAAAAAAPLPRERLAARLARVLADPAQRERLRRRLAASRAPEGKLQFQALARADQGALLATLSSAGGTTADLLADLAAAGGLELYLPVPAHRRAWRGEADLLVATLGRDGEAPLAFAPDGSARRLDPARPPATPVIALVPQETDFTGGRPALAQSCADWCGDGDAGAGSGSSVSSGGVFLTAIHFEESFESWLKGKPEYEFHVYGADGGGDAEQLSCTGEHAGGDYAWDQNERDWSGSALLLGETDRAAYAARHPNAPLRIVAFEDDDEPCVARVDGGRVSAMLSAVDAAYRAWTSGKVEPWYLRGLRSAPSTFNLVRAIRNAITTGDDLIGNAVESGVAGSAPGGANWVLKTEGTRTTGWFTTEFRR